MFNPCEDLITHVNGKKYATILADPPWQFTNRTGKMAPEHKRLNRYPTMKLEDICNLPVKNITEETAHLYLWVPNALLPNGLTVLKSWGFEYKSNLIWYKIRKDGGPDRRGVGFYFRNVTEMLLFGVKGKNARTLQPGRSQENIISTQKREHSRKPDEQYDLITQCSWGPFLEMFARGPRPGWDVWGNQSEEYTPTWSTYSNHSQAEKEEKEELIQLHLFKKAANAVYAGNVRRNLILEDFMEEITVCDRCLRASCWQGLFMCDYARLAGTVQKTLEELKELNLEHPSYWKTDKQLAEQN